MSVLESIRDRLTDEKQPNNPAAVMAVDDAIDVLSNERRRYVIDVLSRLDPEESLTKRDLSEHVAARETQTRPTLLDTNARKTVYVCLHQTHLPALHDAGIIHYDENRGTVEPTDCVTALADAKQAINQTLQGASV